MDKIKYWIWLTCTVGFCSNAPQRLLAAFNNDIKLIYEAEREDYKDIKLTERQLNALCNKSLDEPARIIEWCGENKVGILTFDDKKFPARLRELANAPIVLYYIGELYDIDALLCLAGVGTRTMTKYGHDTAYSFCYDLSRSGAVIVSGLAAGIDTTCHRAALDAGGRTIAVLGCRINKVYPTFNRDIMAEIARKGLLITEYHPFSHTHASNFAQRNRIISGLCQGTIVFEADAGSGSLITARDAIRQGRKLYSLPGNIGASNSLGTNQLISQGAKPILRSGDVLDDFRFLYPTQIKNDRVFDYSPAKKAFDDFLKNKRKKDINHKKANENQKKKSETLEQKQENEPEALDISMLTELEKRIYELLDFEIPVSCDKLALEDVTFGEIMSALTMMELNGYITCAPGNTFIKNHK